MVEKKKKRVKAKRGASKRQRYSYFPVDAGAIERAVEEGVLMSRTALTMATMNHIIVGAVRNKVDYNPEQIAEFVSDELHQLVLEQVNLAEHMKKLMLEFPPMSKKSRTVADYHWLSQRRVTYSALASELDRLHADPEFISEAVDASQKWAWSELSRAIEGRLEVEVGLASSPAYETERLERMRELKEIDLPVLAASAWDAGFGHEEGAPKASSSKASSSKALSSAVQSKGGSSKASRKDRDAANTDGVSRQAEGGDQSDGKE